MPGRPQAFRVKTIILIYYLYPKISSFAGVSSTLIIMDFFFNNLTLVLYLGDTCGFVAARHINSLVP